LQDLFPYVVGFFLLDCVVYLRRGRSAFVARLGGRFSVVDAVGLHILPPLPVVRVVFGEDLFIGASAAGVHALAREPADGGAVPDAESFVVLEAAALVSAQIEGRALVDGAGRRLCVAASLQGTERIREVAAELASRAAVPPLPRLFQRAIDRRALHARRLAFEAYVMRLKVLGMLVWIQLFLLLPWAVYDAEFAPRLPLILAGFTAAYVSAVVVAYRALRACGTNRKECIRSLLPLLFFPPSAGHILTIVERAVYPQTTSLAAAAEFLEPETFLQFAGRYVRRIGAASRAAAGSAAEPVWEAQYRLAEAVLQDAGSSVAALLSTPRPNRDSTAASWCPACGTDYRSGVGLCSDCGGELEAYLG
jgi:hypothetical protein